MKNIMENLKYPIGRFKLPLSFNKEIINNCIQTIQDFPEQVKNEVFNLSETALEKQYRPEGWTIRQVIHHCR